MNTDDIKCRLCGAGLFEASERGAYLARVNPKGEPCINECRPNCDRDSGNQDDALIAAIFNKD